MNIVHSWRMQRTVKIIQLAFTCLRLVVTNKKDELPLAIYESFRGFGGIYIKFLQILAIQSDLFSKLQHYDIYDVYDQVEHDEINIALFLRTELGFKASEIVLQDSQPFAAGSFGQVYHAKYNNKNIVVKVLRPSVIRELNYDLKVLSAVSFIIDILGPGRAVSVRKLYRELATTTRAETNYKLEADYARMLYKRYENHSYVHIPYTYRDFSTKYIICQDYVGGVPATELIRKVDQGIDPREYIRDTLGSDIHEQLVGFGKEILSSVFRYGSTYGDPHPGNIKFLPDNKIGIIDYGVQASAPKNLTGFYKLIEQYQKVYNGTPDLNGYSRALLEMYGGDIVEAIKSIDAYTMKESSLLDSIIRVAESMMQENSEKTRSLMENNKMMNLFGTVVNKDNRFCLKYSLDGPELMRSANLCIALVTSLRMKREVMRDIYNGVLDDISELQFEDTASQLHPEAAVEILASWLDQVAYKNPQLYRIIRNQEAINV